MRLALLGRPWGLGTVLCLLCACCIGSQGTGAPEAAAAQVPGASPVPAEPTAHEISGEALDEEQEHEKEYTLEDLELAKSTTAGYVLLLTVAFGLALLYLVHSSDEDIRGTTWKMISSSLSIFIAVFSFTGIKLVFGAAIPHSWPPLLLSVPLFLVIWLSTQAVLLVMKRHIQLRSFGMLSGHVGAFAAIEVAKNLMELAIFHASPLHTLYLLLVLITTFTFLIWATNHSFERMRQRVHEDCNHEEWHEASLDAEHDTAAISLGYVFSELMQAVLLGSAPVRPVLAFEPHERPIISRSAYWIFVAISAGCLILVFWFSYVQDVVTDRITGVVKNVNELAMQQESSDEEAHGEKAQRISRQVAAFFAMSASWCILALSQWTLLLGIKREYGNEAVVSEVLSFITCSLIVCILSIVAIFLIDFLADRKFFDEVALRTVITAIGILVGLSWESTFDVCIESIVATDVERKERDHHLRRIFLASLIQLVLALLLIPAWTLYILPQAEPELAHHLKDFPSLNETFCCGVCPTRARRAVCVRSHSDSDSEEAGSELEKDERDAPNAREMSRPLAALSVEALAASS